MTGSYPRLGSSFDGRHGKGREIPAFSRGVGKPRLPVDVAFLDGGTVVKIGFLARLASHRGIVRDRSCRHGIEQHRIGIFTAIAIILCGTLVVFVLHGGRVVAVKLRRFLGKGGGGNVKKIAAGGPVVGPRLVIRSRSGHRHPYLLQAALRTVFSVTITERSPERPGFHATA